MGKVRFFRLYSRVLQSRVMSGAVPLDRVPEVVEIKTRGEHLDRGPVHKHRRGDLEKEVFICRKDQRRFLLAATIEGLINEIIGAMKVF